MTDQNKKDKLIYLLQKGLPLVSRPFADLASRLEMSEADLLHEIHTLQKSGLIRRFGGIFNSASLGFKACLCGINVADNEIDQVNSLLISNPGITHSYLRDGVPNLWFTITVQKSQYNMTMKNLKNCLLPYNLLAFPAVKSFKIQVIFDKTGAVDDTQVPVFQGKTLELAEEQKQVVRYLQGDIPISAELYDNIAAAVDYKKSDLLELLTGWQQAGALKRIAGIIRHRQFGFKGNAMCVWHIPEKYIDDAGSKIAEHSCVSHCYQREIHPEFSFNLYAMLHAENQEQALTAFKDLGKIAFLKNGHMLFSIKELKKTSPVYF